MNSKFYLLTFIFVIYNILIYALSKIFALSILFYLPLVIYLIAMIAYFFANKKKDIKEADEFSVPINSFDKKNSEVEVSRFSFEDIAGLEEIKDDFNDIIDFLNNEQKYTSMGAKIPRGAILYGPPGTGKTILAKAIAGEAKANFIYASGSEFVEKYVGVGAKRVRSLFERAKKEAPSIVFIDEIDALGGKRNSESNNEKDQTLNQLLVELDGFNNVQNVVVIAATNRIDLLDEALLRPGRFDRKIYVGNPNYNSRLKILEVHTKNKPLDKKINLSDIANKTHGFSGAQLANIANEAALKAIRDKNKKILQENFEFAIEKIAAGLEIKNPTVSKKEKQTVAYHEAGHAVAAKVLNIDKIQKISIIPRDKALGYVMKFPIEDKYLYTKNELYNRITVFLAGRAAEEIFVGEISSGASNDLKESTNLVYEMICNYGMSQNLENFYIDEQLFKYFVEPIKLEAAELIKRLYKDSISLLEANKDVTEYIAQYLMKYECIDSYKLEEIFDQFKYETQTN